MKRRPIEYRLRQITIIIMLVTAILVVVTGIILYMLPEGTNNSELGKGLMQDMHIYAGFISAGMLVIHLYLNRRPLKRYFVELFS
jgi:hypothetical protein